MAIAEIVVQGLVGAFGVLVGAMMTHRWELAHRIRQRRRDEALSMLDIWEDWLQSMMAGHVFAARCVLFHREERSSLPGRVMAQKPDAHYTTERWTLSNEHLRLSHELTWKRRRAVLLWDKYDEVSLKATTTMLNACQRACEGKSRTLESGENDAIACAQSALKDAVKVINAARIERDRRLQDIDNRETEIAGVGR